MAEMFTILQELQSEPIAVLVSRWLNDGLVERKASKSSARSAAFQNEKAKLFAAARQRAEGAIRSGHSSMSVVIRACRDLAERCTSEKARATIEKLKTEEASQEAKLTKLRALWESHDVRLCHIPLSDGYSTG